jgi:5-enolpyruvylshikimate-3-phosphate synthase
MIYKIKAPYEFDVNVLLPSSKSISNRVLILNSLSLHPKHINNISVCDDTNVVIKALDEKNYNIDIGAAGTAMRFLTAYLSGQKGCFTITGTERMKNRPIKILVDALRSAGADIEYIEKEGYPPLRINGKVLKGGSVHLDGSISSQYLSALLMIAPVMTNGLRMHLTGNIISKPYIDITIRLMRRFGVIVFEEGQTYTVPPQQYSPVENFTVESDWSAASYWYEMMALSKNDNASVTLQGLLPDSLQGDSSIVDFFDKLGVCTTFSEEGVVLMKKHQCKNDDIASFLAMTKNTTTNSTATSLRGGTTKQFFDFVSMPDMAQTAVVTCVMLNIPFHFTGLQSLKIKETDRLNALKTELLKFGYPLEIHNNNSLSWNGERCEAEPSPVVSTYDDHRMAMAFAPMSLCIENGICIADPEVISKSYPTYWDDLRKAGFIIKTVEPLF